MTSWWTWTVSTSLYLYCRVRHHSPSSTMKSPWVEFCYTWLCVRVDRAYLSDSTTCLLWKQLLSESLFVLWCTPGITPRSAVNHNVCERESSLISSKVTFLENTPMQMTLNCIYHLSLMLHLLKATLWNAVLAPSDVEWLKTSLKSLAVRAGEFKLIGTRQQLAKVDIKGLVVGDATISHVTAVKNVGSWLNGDVNMGRHINKMWKTLSCHSYNTRLISKLFI